MMTYEEALHAIATLAPRGWRLGLDRMQAFADAAGLADALGGPTGPQYIHVTGTNGKGSVTAYVQNILSAAGHRTGGYFSPYVLDPRERWQLDCMLIDPLQLAKLTEELWPLGEQFANTEFGGITEFEFKTALGFLFWKKENCDWVALEVGLGGRLDATNIVTPAASVIVSIGLDHTNILGTTHAEIAFEKAGIIKAGRPLILGSVNSEARQVILGVAKAHAAPVWEFGAEILLSNQAKGYTVTTPAGEVSGLRPGLKGSAQPHNCALAVAAVLASGAKNADADAIRCGTAATTLPGRFQSFRKGQQTWILDGAHNGEAAQVLAQSLADAGLGQVLLIAGMVAGHEPSRFFGPILPFCSKVLLVPIDNPRAQLPEDLVPSMGSTPYEICSSVEAAVKRAAGAPTVIVAGSFYLLSDVYQSAELS